MEFIEIKARDPPPFPFFAWTLPWGLIDANRRALSMWEAKSGEESSGQWKETAFYNSNSFGYAAPNMKWFLMEKHRARTELELKRLRPTLAKVTQSSDKW